MTLQAPYDDPAEPSTVILRGMDEVEYDDLPAAAEIRPGMLVEHVPGAEQVRPHSTAGGSASPLFAVEYRKFGMAADDSTVLPNLSGDVHDTYNAGDMTKFAAFDKAHRVWALVPAGATVNDGDFVESAGGGLVQTHDGTTVDQGGTGTVTISDNIVVGKAIETVDNALGTAPARVRVEVTT